MSRSPEGRSRPTTMSRRTAARLAAVQAVYEMELAECSAEVVLKDFADRWLPAGLDGEAGPAAAARRVDPDASFLGDLVRGVAMRLADLDGMIAPALSEEWPLVRLEAVLRAILRVGAYELFARADVPLRVVISEYVDIAHAFFDAKEAGLVNAVLDRIGRVLRAEEAGDDNGDTARPR